MSKMALVEEVERCENDEPVPRWFTETQFWLRALAITFTGSSIPVMLTSGSAVLLDGVMRTNAPYYYSSAFKFLLGVDMAVCALCLLSLALPIICYDHMYKKLQFSRKHWYYLFLHDLIVMAVSIFACGAASSIGYVGIYGQPETFWNKICSNNEDLCTSVGISVASSYAAVLCFFALTVISSYVLIKPWPSLTQDQEPELV